MFIYLFNRYSSPIRYRVTWDMDKINLLLIRKLLNWKPYYPIIGTVRQSCTVCPIPVKVRLPRGNIP